MSVPAPCPVCSTVLSFPEMEWTPDPVRCPVCNSRFMIEGRRVAHLSFTDYYAFLGVAPDVPDDELRKVIRENSRTSSQPQS